ncbi:MAG: hypothetical protein IJB68_11210 [Ruminococcus sp.]|nr:hypothetical protein [Ruminococcus sp.]
MKALKIISAFTAAAMLSGCSFISNLTEEITTINEIEQPVMPVANEMPDVEEVRDFVYDLEWYDELCEGLLSGDPIVRVEYKVKSREVERALLQMKSDCPEIFWDGNTYFSETAPGGADIHVSVLDGVDEENIPEMTEEIYKAAEKIIDQIPKGSSDYEKVLFVHDYIIENTQYDHIGAILENKGMCHNIYGCLIEGKAVCIGYAEAFQLIMNMLDIESGVCTGSNHAWNYVKIDGEYYWIDTTWDDDDSGEPIHTYFLVTTDQLLRSRTFDTLQSYVPECTETESNYFVKNGGYFETYDEKEILGYVGENSDKEKCQIMFGSYEAYSEALNELIGKSKLTRADGVDDLRYVRTDEMFCLTLLLGGED